MKITVHILSGDDDGGTWGEAYPTEQAAYDALIVDHLGEKPEDVPAWLEENGYGRDDVWEFISAHKSDPSLDTYQIGEETLDVALCDQPLPATGAEQVAEAIECLKRARDLLKEADNRQTLKRVQLALSSAKGAARIQSSRHTKELQLRNGFGAKARLDELPRDANPISQTAPLFALHREAWFHGWDQADQLLKEAADFEREGDTAQAAGLRATVARIAEGR